MLAGRRGITESADPAHGSLDLTGQVLGAVWIGGLVYAVIAGDLVVGLIAVRALAAFVLIELRAPHPMLPIRLFSRARFSVSTLGSFVIGFAAYPASVLIALYLQQGPAGSPRPSPGCSRCRTCWPTCGVLCRPPGRPFRREAGAAGGPLRRRARRARRARVPDAGRDEARTGCWHWSSAWPASVSGCP